MTSEDVRALIRDLRDGANTWIGSGMSVGAAVKLMVRSADALEALSVTTPPTVTDEQVREVHAWCPACGGSGMVMEFGPTDCPNLDIHRALDRAALHPGGETNG